MSASISHKRTSSVAGNTMDHPGPKRPHDQADNSQEAPKVYLVKWIHTMVDPQEMSDSDIVDVYASLKDAVNKVRMMQETEGWEDLVDAEYSEAMEEDGRVWWRIDYDDGSSKHVEIDVFTVKPSGSVEERAWRPIGESKFDIEGDEEEVGEKEEEVKDAA